MNEATPPNPATFITPEELLVHWQGHRRLTRRVIEAFPDRELFHYSLGGMRPFSEMAREMMGMAGMGIRGIVTGRWEKDPELEYHSGPGPQSREELLRRWDGVTATIDELWPQLTLQRFHETVCAFGQFEGPIYGSILYWIDNEIHHRGQGYVYLRSLGIQTPYFWER